MPTARIRRSDGTHCFHCNARVEEADARCPECGREFAPARPGPGAVPAAAPERRPGRLGERIRLANEGRRRGYLAAVLVLAGLAVVSGLVFRGRAERPLLPRPESPEVESRVFEQRGHPAGRIERSSLLALVRPGLPEDSLRAALDWLLYRAVDERNRAEGGNLRVVWAYLYEEEAASATGWRAMAIWQAPGLSEAVRPSGIGADVFRAGDVQYVFFNRLRTGPGGGNEN